MANTLRKNGMYVIDVTDSIRRSYWRLQ